MRNSRLVLLPLALALLASCTAGGTSDATDDGAPGTEFKEVDAMRPDGPLRGIAMTGDVSRAKPVVKPRLTLTTDDTVATAAIGIGEVSADSPLTVTWYRVGESNKREELFSQDIAVQTGGRAFSQGVSATGLAPGIYDTEATLGDSTTHTPWVVHEAAASSPVISGKARALAVEAPVGDEDWNTPDSGASWYDDGEAPPSDPRSTLDHCEFRSVLATISPMRDLSAHAYWSGPCTTGTLAASVSGPPVILATNDHLEGPISSVYGATDICELPGGSDLPGTRVHLEATGSANGSSDYTLEDYGRTLTAAINGTPAAGATVKPGDDVELLALGMVFIPALGVKSLSVKADGAELKSVGNSSNSSEPVSCDLGRTMAAATTTYNVPESPPPIINLCANAIGFDGTKSEDCIQYFAGEVWKGTGTFRSTVTYPGGSGTCRDAEKIDYTFGVDNDGKIDGTGLATHTTEASCTFPDEGTQWETRALTVTGARNGDTFDITFGVGSEMEPPGSYELGGFLAALALSGGEQASLAIQGSSATGDLSFSEKSGNPPATYEASGNLDAHCLSDC